MVDLLPDIIDNDVHVQAKIIKVLYHWDVSLWLFGELVFPNPTRRLPFTQVELA
jgi:hypothetical protein